MKFTPGQVQETLQLSPAAFRHWKTALPPLCGRNGYSPCFTLGDLLALAVVKSLTEDVGIRIGALCGLAVDLFVHCSQPWAVLERSVLIVEPLHPRVTSIAETQPLAPEEVMIAVPLRPIITAMRERLLLEQSGVQQEPLRFPPTAIGSGVRRRGNS